MNSVRPIHFNLVQLRNGVPVGVHGVDRSVRPTSWQAQNIYFAFDGAKGDESRDYWTSLVRKKGSDKGFTGAVALQGVLMAKESQFDTFKGDPEPHKRLFVRNPYLAALKGPQDGPVVVDAAVSIAWRLNRETCVSMECAKAIPLGSLSDLNFHSNLYDRLTATLRPDRLYRSCVLVNDSGCTNAFKALNAKLHDKRQNALANTIAELCMSDPTTKALGYDPHYSLLLSPTKIHQYTDFASALQSIGVRNAKTEGFDSLSAAHTRLGYALYDTEGQSMHPPSVVFGDGFPGERPVAEMLFGSNAGVEGELPSMVLAERFKAISMANKEHRHVAGDDYITATYEKHKKDHARFEQFTHVALDWYREKVAEKGAASKQFTSPKESE